MATINRNPLFATLSWGLLVGAILLLQTALAQEPQKDAQTEARAVIRKAIAAHGGEANLDKFKKYSMKWEGKRPVENMLWESTNVVTYEMPDKVRIDFEIANPNGGKLELHRVVNGKNGWQWRLPTQLRDLREPLIAAELDEMYAHWVASLVPLSAGPFTFDLIGQSTVDDRDAIGIRVSHKNRPDVNLYFDKTSTLLLKSERRTNDPQTNQEYTAESIYRDHKRFEGVSWPTKRLDKKDGKDLDDNAGRFELSDYRPLEKVEAATFARP